MALMNPLLGSNLVTASAPFDPTLIGNSVWLDGSADCLTKSLSSGAAQSRLIISTWVQRTAFSSTAEYAMVTSIGGVASSRANRLKFEDDGITVHLESTTAATTIIKTSAVYRDVGWYHVLLSIDGNVVDSTQLYVNGIRQTTSITTGSAFTGSLGSFGHGGATTMIGKYNNTASDSYFLPAYLAQTTMLVGQSIQNSDVAITDFLDTFTFGTNGSQFAPKADADIAALATTAGGNSFCLDFSSASVALSSGVTPTSNAGTVSGSLSNLTDGNFTSDWRSDVDPATSVDNDHVAFDLGSAKDVKAVKITGRSSITGNFKVQFSDNGSDFTDTGTTFSNVSITTTANTKAKISCINSTRNCTFPGRRYLH